MSLLQRGSDAISPTAHYTGEVWRRAGLSHPELGTIEGRLLHASLRPAMALSSALGGDTLEAFLLARHRLIDRLLEDRIAAGEVGQVIEIAAGMSPRGLRLSARHPELIYVEADLPAMAARKREALRRAGAGHGVVDVDALADDGPRSLAHVARELDRTLGLAIVTEGLINYFPRSATDGIWTRIAATLSRFPTGVYLSDLHLRANNAGAVQRVTGAVIGAFVRGQVHFPYADASDALAALRAAGFAETGLHDGSESGSTDRGVERVHVVEAETARSEAEPG